MKTKVLVELPAKRLSSETSFPTKRASLRNEFPFETSSSAKRVSLSNEFSCETTFIAKPLSLPNHFPCQTTFLPNHFPCQTTFLPNHFPCQTTFPAKPLSLLKHFPCQTTFPAKRVCKTESPILRITIFIENSYTPLFCKFSETSSPHRCYERCS